jgi:WD40 repeat protein
MTDPTPPNSPDTTTRAVLANREPARALAEHFTHNLAVVIGINRYRHVRQLKTARPDAERLAALLQKQDRDIHDWYEVVTFYDEQAECTALREYLSTALPARVREAGEEAAVSTRVLFYFAGHGDAEFDDAGRKGYLFPQDAQPDVEESLLDMAWVQEVLAGLPCQHVLIILDCCSAGALPKQASTRSALRPAPLYWDYLERYVGGRARQVITSAAHNQQALDIANYKAGERDTGEDHSPFAQALFEALDPAFAGGSPLRSAARNGVVTTTDLYQYVSDALYRRVGDKQTPGLWTLSTHEQGEFVFLLPGTRLELDPAPDLTKQHNPWPHASTYGLQQAGLFAGRDREIEELAELVAANPLVAVTGSSAVGKSSLVQAGLLPWLAEEGIRQPDESDISWQILPPLTLDAQAPLQTVIKHTNQTLGQSSESELEVAPAVVWAHSGTGQRLLLALDLTEALFEPAAQAELSALVNWLEQAKQMGGLHVVLTLRSDHWFMPGAGAGSERKQLLPSAIRYELGLMNRDGLRQVIERPAAARMIYLPPPEWINELVEAVEGEREPAALPLLSAILHRMYLRYADGVMGGQRCGDRTLTLDDYNAVGGVEGVIGDLAECFHRELPADAAYVTTLQHVLLRLVDVEEGRYKRRCAWREELDFPDVAATARAQAVIDGLTACGLAVQGANAEGRAYVELGHIALVQAWPLLGDCLRERSEEWVMLRALAAQVEDWLPYRHKADLWDDDPRLPQLEQMLRPAAGRFRWVWRVLAPARGVPSDTKWLNRAELAFVQESIQARAWFWRRVVGAATLLALVLLTATVVSLGLQDQAVKARATAVAEATRASDAKSTAVAEATRALNAEAMARAEAERAEDETRRALGSRAEALAYQVPAQGSEALVSAVRAIGPYFVKEQPIPPEVIAGLTAAITAGRGSIPLQLSGDRIAFARLSPDGDLVFIAGTKGDLSVWDRRDGHKLVSLERVDSEIIEVDFAPARNLVAAITKSGGALWNLTSGKLVFVHEGTIGDPTGFTCEDLVVKLAEQSLPVLVNGHEVIHAALSLDTSLILTSDENGTLQLWERHNGQLLRDFDNKSPSVSQVAFSAAGKYVGALIGGSPALWYLDSGELAVSPGGSIGNDYERREISELLEKAREQTSAWCDIPASLTTIKDRRLLAKYCQPSNELFVLGATGSPYASTLEIYNKDGELVSNLVGHQWRVELASFSETGNRLASGGEDRNVLVWEVDAKTKDWRAVATLAGHKLGVRYLFLSRDGRFVLSIDAAGEARIWDLSANTSLHTITTPTGISFAKFAPNSYFFVSAAQHVVYAWDALSEKWLWRKLRTMIGVNPVISPDGKQVLIAQQGGAIDAFDMVTGDFVRRVDTKLDPLTAVLFSPKGDELLTTGGQGNAIIWDWEDAQPRQSFPLESGSFPILQYEMFAPHGRILAVTYRWSNGVVTLWDTETGSLVHELSGNGRPGQPVFSPDSKRLVVPDWYGKAHLWNVESGERIAALEGHQDQVLTAEFSSDGRMILTASEDGTAMLWDGYSGEWIMTLSGHTNRLKAAVFSPDDTRIATASRDGTVRLWDTMTGMQMGVLHSAGHVEVHLVEFSSDGRYILAVMGDAEGKTDSQYAMVYPATAEALFTEAMDLLRSRPEFEQVQQYDGLIP